MTLTQIGNVFSFLFAGHGKCWIVVHSIALACSHQISETTSQSLAATLAFLALNSDLQDELVTQVQEVTRGRDDNTLVSAVLSNAFLPLNFVIQLVTDYGKLDKVLATFYEGIRMFRR